MIQKFALDGAVIGYVILPRLLEEILPNTHPPKGIIGYDVDSGLVLVKLNAVKEAYMKMGKYLNKAGETPEVARDYSSKLRAAINIIKGAKLQITETPEQVVHVYEQGPHSCMSGCDSVQVYCTDSVAVAFVEIDDDIVARTVICKDPEMGLQYSRIYGNTDILRPLLTKAGYAQGDLEGCTLARVYDADGLIMCPYLDNAEWVTDQGDHLSLDSCGDFSGQNESGVLSVVCDECECITDNDETSYCEFTERMLCDGCFEDTHVNIDGETYHTESDDIIRDIDGWWHLVDDVVFIKAQNGYLHRVDATYIEYSEEWCNTDDTINAITNMDTKEGEPCPKFNCTIADDGRWVHDDLVHDYNRQMNLEFAT